MGMERSTSGLYLHVDFDKPKELEFNQKRVRNAFAKVGRGVQDDARRLVARRAISKAGEAPGTRTGGLSRSIGYKVPTPSDGRPGFMVRIAPNQKGGRRATRLPSGDDDDFYPAFLFYGVKRKAKRGRSHRKGASGGSGWKIAPRKNFMTEALSNRRSWAEKVLFNALKKSVVAK
ncbi:hypothetical protein ACX1H4_11990 [Yersinia enterocolitica]|uniref:hypothetical protein n=1 Tax=Yersinia enterocolitica TaxID=630 RepID=UPI0005DC4711|nr:hypothetical protein [Yersinia enterocolitica]EKN3500127.1 hypothetical protein [Yersinia enterocolitica]EKN3888068.1 hypothetical protein [Yersinia enterocolitica]EKN3943068.1 hypothetical protein [Yersinia enterocolitica]EKN4022906.1 hypothetical protein [Yersinia enterocolitica]EKN4060865.1 hypothetical protein [Yersinia enterocolitica]